jgi:hypothetical protein
MKRLPRFDRSSHDILGIKSNLSNFSNSVLDQQWIKNGSPSNIQIIELKMGVENSKHLRSLIYGKMNSGQIDGIHLRGPGARRHFTYRAVQAVKQVLFPAKRTFSANQAIKDDHKNCPQTKYQTKKTSDARSGNYAGRTFTSRQFQSHNRKGNSSYADAVTGGPAHKTFNGQNIYNHLN